MKKFILALVVASSFVSIAQAISCPAVEENQKSGDYLGAGGTTWNVWVTNDKHPQIDWPPHIPGKKDSPKYNFKDSGAPYCITMIGGVGIGAELIISEKEKQAFWYDCEENAGDDSCKTNAFKKKEKKGRGDDDTSSDED
jgi:hypothetical protein